MSAANRKIVAHVVSAVPLPSDKVRQMEERFSLSTGNDIQVKTEVDESIVGGLIIHMGDKVIDASLDKQLQIIREKMLKT